MRSMALGAPFRKEIPDTSRNWYAPPLIRMIVSPAMAIPFFVTRSASGSPSFRSRCTAFRKTPNVDPRRPNSCCTRAVPQYARGPTGTLLMREDERLAMSADSASVIADTMPIEVLDGSRPDSLAAAIIVLDEG
jgi:hypothetical protein